MLNKKSLSERDICTKFITPAIEKAGWKRETHFLEEVGFTAGKIYFKGKLVARGKQKRADYVLYYKQNIPIAIIEAKDNNHSVSDGMQQGLEYAETLEIPCVFSSNGDGFVFHDRTAEGDEPIERELSLDEFPTPLELWQRYKKFKGITTPDEEKIISQDYHIDGSGKAPRYYQQIAINRTVEAIAKGQNKVLLVMATGTGKTYTAFQIVYRLWKAGAKKRILFLADRKILVHQASRAFEFFKDVKTTILKRQIDKAYEVYFSLYQGITGNEEDKNIYKQFSPDFFDLIIIDECHRGSAAEDSSWREVLSYFNKATHIGLTATPKETKEVSNIEYFGQPLYTYSLKEGINDGFLAPYRVLKVGLNVDYEGYRPEKGKRDKSGQLVEDRIYNTKDFDRNLVIDERTQIVAQKLSDFMRGTDRFAKTIVFCEDIDHAERMRMALMNCNTDLATQNPKYVMRITGDNDEGKREVDNFTNPEEKYPVIVTTSELLTTGVDAQTCKIIVLDCNIKSMTKFKQIVGRGTRINEEYGKLFFTIIDFKKATDLFADKNFDGDPQQIKVLGENDDISNIEAEEMTDETPITENDGTPIIPTIRTLITLPPPPTTRQKIYVNNVEVTVLNEREVHFDKGGKMITIKLTDYSRNQVLETYPTLHDFLNRWALSDKKAAIISELEEQGVMIAELIEAVGDEYDLFDLLCHVAYDAPALTRKERANNVKKRNYFTKYGEQARQILETLLEKYADEGIQHIENLDVLKVKPFDKFGSPLQIIRLFGGKDGYLQAVKELEREVYAVG
jgi:type I restriction enzyme, R subunit